MRKRARVVGPEAGPVALGLRAWKDLLAGAESPVPGGDAR